MKRLITALWIALAPLGAAADTAEELRAAEIAFSRSAEDRDLERFVGFLAPDAVFSGSGEEFRGPEAIRTAWAPFFDREGPSISWRPESVTVLEDGSLGMSRGPYRIVTRNEAGEEITLTGTFFSVWRHTEDGWKIILDGGTPATPVSEE